MVQPALNALQSWPIPGGVSGRRSGLKMSRDPSWVQANLWQCTTVGLSPHAGLFSDSTWYLEFLCTKFTDQSEGQIQRLKKNNTDQNKKCCEGIQEQQIQETPGCPDPLLLSWHQVLLQFLMSFGSLFTLLIFVLCFCVPICLQCLSDFTSVCLVFVLVSLCSLCPLFFILFWLIHFLACLLCLEFPPLWLFSSPQFSLIWIPCLDYAYWTLNIFSSKSAENGRFIVNNIASMSLLNLGPFSSNQ